MINLIGKTPAEVEEILEPIVDRAFRCRQVVSWITQRDARTFAQMTNLPITLRAQLASLFTLVEPPIAGVQRSTDGSAKYLFELDDGQTVEGVVMPGEGRSTLCLSSQTGCAVGCTFCVTGILGAGRNLRTDEIVGQYRQMVREVGGGAERVNLVFMGMGEPLLNIQQLAPTLDILYERISPKRITVSTAGIIPGIRWFSELSRPPKLAVSLNAPDQKRREVLMPISRRYPLNELIAVLREVPLSGGRRLTFEYVIVNNFNDAVDDARAVCRLLRGIPVKINVIPLNEDPRHPAWMRRPEDEVINTFAATVRNGGFAVTVRWSKGLDVDAACGQLKGRHQMSDVGSSQTSFLEKPG